MKFRQLSTPAIEVAQEMMVIWLAVARKLLLLHDFLGEVPQKLLMDGPSLLNEMNDICYLPKNSLTFNNVQLKNKYIVMEIASTNR